MRKRRNRVARWQVGTVVALYTWGALYFLDAAPRGAISQLAAVVFACWSGVLAFFVRSCAHAARHNPNRRFWVKFGVIAGATLGMLLFLLMSSTRSGLLW